MRTVSFARPALLVALALGGVSSAAGQGPRINLETFTRHEAGWIPVDQTGDASKGSVTVERIVWPLFYLHWKPLEAGQTAASTLGAADAEKAVRTLWDGLVIDGPLEPRPLALPAHEAMAFETTTGGGQTRNRYYVWACPQTGRVIVADTSVSLKIHAPRELLDVMRNMVRSVRCHADAPIEENPTLDRRYDVPDGDISYSHARVFAPVPGYRVQNVFGGHTFSREQPAVTKTLGQDLAVEAEAYKRLYLTWYPSHDYPMSYDVIRQGVEDYWRDRSQNIMIFNTQYINDIWIADGMIQSNDPPGSVPPARHHKFRAWMWRRDGMTYFALGSIGAVRLGRRIMTGTFTQEEWNTKLEAMFQAIVY